MKIFSIGFLVCLMTVSTAFAIAQDGTLTITEDNLLYVQTKDKSFRLPQDEFQVKLVNAEVESIEAGQLYYLRRQKNPAFPGGNGIM